jgi:hypothetical protein
MRPIERIDNFINLIDWNWLLYTKWKLDKEDLVAKTICYMNNPTLIEAWKENPDQRIGQLLINLGLIDDSMERWCTEECDILIDQGIPPEECLYWTSMYDKDENLLDEPLTRKVSDLTKSHITNILTFMKTHNGRISPQMETAFQNVLNKTEQSEPESMAVAA